ncbi:MAG: hypothetical protein ACWA5L_08975 [bacterium]
MLKIIIALFSLLATCLMDYTRADPLPPDFDLILAEAEAHATLQPSFTLSFQWKDYDAVVMHYDAPQKSWQLLSGRPDLLSKTGQKKLKNIKKEAKPGGLIYADFRKYLTQVHLTKIDGAIAIYEFIPPELKNKNLTPEQLSHMSAQLFVDTKTKSLIKYNVESDVAFSPLPGVQITYLSVIHEFSRTQYDLPPLQSKMHVRRLGRSLSGQIDEEFTVRFYDYSFSSVP